MAHHPSSAFPFLFLTIIDSIGALWSISGKVPGHHDSTESRGLNQLWHSCWGLLGFYMKTNALVFLFFFLFGGAFSPLFDRETDVSVKRGEEGENDMWQRTPSSGLKLALPRRPDYRSGAPTTRLWPGPQMALLRREKTGGEGDLCCYMYSYTLGRRLSAGDA